MSKLFFIAKNNGRQYRRGINEISITYQAFFHKCAGHFIYLKTRDFIRESSLDVPTMSDTPFHKLNLAKSFVLSYFFLDNCFYSY